MKYQNPILYGDYSDPDVIRSGEFFYMVSSSFTYLPGIPVLRSRDLTRWDLIGYAASSLPFERYARPAHKRGTWAPSIRVHDGLFYVYVCLPDEGLLCFTAADPSDRWDCHIVKEVTGWIDPCPFWDRDGSAWLLHGFAGSRAGIKNILYLHRMSPDGLHILDTGRLVYSGDDHGDETVEGPKIDRIGEWYYILCPAGGVPGGYQLCLRSDRLNGPYERKVVLSQGKTAVNGPHQGGMVQGPDGQWWFIHFQDRGVYGRVPHLQPVTWRDGWPVMGRDGEPIAEGETPYPAGPGNVRDMSDDMKGPLKPHWQWQANPREEWYREGAEGLRLRACPYPTLFEAGSFLSQLMQYRDFDMDVTVRPALEAGDRCGVGMMGYVWHYAALEGDGVSLYRGEAREVSLRERERTGESRLCTAALPPAPERVLRLSVRDGVCRYFVRTGDRFEPLGGPLPMENGGWTGARPGIFCFSAEGRIGGSALFSSVRVTPA